MAKEKLTRSELISLVEAISRGDVKTVRAQLHGLTGVSIRVPQRKNRPARETLLMLAAEQGDLPIVRLLISLRANVNEINEFRQSALWYAVRKNQIATVNLLLKSGTDPNQVTVDGDSILHEVAAGSINVKILRSLIKNGADPRITNKLGCSALHIAAFHGRTEVVQVLIRAGADVNHRDRHSQGPLTCAISRNHKDVATLLLKNGANPRLQPEALGVAASEGHLQFVKMLIENGWDVRSKSHQGRTPLQHARIRKHKTVIGALTDAGAS